MFMEPIRNNVPRFVILILLVLALSLPTTSADSGLWNYVGNAYPSSGSLVLTQNVNNQVGAIWLKDDVYGPFTADFQYKAGGGSGGDGFVFMFYKNTKYSLPGGGNLGFGGKGYGIEFDSFSNSQNDMQGKHIALIKDGAFNHLASAYFDGVNDNQWHRVQIDVGKSSVVVYVDGRSVLSKDISFDQSYGGIGFSAATGGLNDWHKIDDVSINYSATVVTYEGSEGSGKGDTSGKKTISIRPTKAQVSSGKPKGI
jgi:hypothetical protein